MYVVDRSNWKVLIDMIITNDNNVVYNCFDTSDDISNINGNQVTYNDTKFHLDILCKHGYLFETIEYHYKKNMDKPIPKDIDFYKLMNYYIKHPKSLSRKIKLEKILKNEL